MKNIGNPNKKPTKNDTKYIPGLSNDHEGLCSDSIIIALKQHTI